MDLKHTLSRTVMVPILSGRSEECSTHAGHKISSLNPSSTNKTSTTEAKARLNEEKKEKRREEKRREKESRGHTLIKIRFYQLSND